MDTPAQDIRIATATTAVRCACCGFTLYTGETTHVVEREAGEFLIYCSPYCAAGLHSVKEGGA